MQVVGFMRKYWAQIIILSVAVVPFIAYFCQFHSYAISDNPEDWGLFGDYIGGFGSVVVSVLAIYASFILQRRSDKNYERKKILTHIYKQVGELKFRKDASVKKIDNLFRYVSENEILMGKDLYRTLITYTDELKAYINDNGVNDFVIEGKIKDRIKEEQLNM